MLLLDEILAVGDADFQRKCIDVFEGLKRQRKTIVLVSHDLARCSASATASSGSTRAGW